MPPATASARSTARARPSPSPTIRRNNLTGITDGANNRWTATYTTGGPARITDPNKNVWTLTYDDSGNLASVADPRTFTVLATRNAAGQILSLADPKGNTRSYQYNADGLLTGFTDALGNKWTYDYDGAARTSVEDRPRGRHTEGRLTPPATASPSLTAGDTQTPFDYSGIQRDSLNRLARYTDSNGNQVTYTYDAAGQLTGITLPGGKTVAYQYDHLHRLSKVSDWQGNFALYSYDAAGWPVSVSVSGGPVTIYQYDGARNLRAIVSTGPDGTPVAGYRYSVDANGNRTAVSALEPNTSAVTKTGTLTYTFDAANRPIVAQRRRNLPLRCARQSHRHRRRGQRQSGLRRIRPPARPVRAMPAGSYGYDSTGLRSRPQRSPPGLRSFRRTAARGDGDRWFQRPGRMVRLRPRPALEGDRRRHAVLLPFRWRRQHRGPLQSHRGRGEYVSLRCAGPAGVRQRRRVENLFHARGESGWVDEGNGLLFTGSQFQFPELRLTLPGDGRRFAAGSGPSTPTLRRGRLLPGRRGQLPRRHRKEDALMRRLLPLAALLALGIAGTACADCRSSIATSPWM